MPSEQIKIASASPNISTSISTSSSGYAIAAAIAIGPARENYKRGLPALRSRSARNSRAARPRRI